MVILYIGGIAMKCFFEKIGRCPMVLAAVMLMTLFFTFERDGRMLQEDIADKVLRFHVRANSDTEQDQELKLKVRDEIIAYLEPVLFASQGVGESKTILAGHFAQLEEVARRVILDNGQTYDVNVYLTEEYFPARVYGAVTLPPGRYEALRVDIGKAQGKNWWCILYPAMCFVESTHAVCDENELEETLTPEEYDFVTGYEIRFKYLTFLNPREEENKQ